MNLDNLRSAAAVAAMAPGGSFMFQLALQHHTTEQKKPLSFLDMPFLLELYRDLPHLREMVAKKCTQVGWTEAGNVFAVGQAGMRGRRHALVLPKDDMAYRFVQDRVQPMMDRVPLYRSFMERGTRKTADNVNLMQIRDGSWRFVGSNVPSNLREFPADSVLVDEVDECNPVNLPLVRDRVRNSESPQLLYLGNPRRPGGISAMFEHSDRREWYHRCTHCGQRQRIDWYDHVVMRDDGGRWTPRDVSRARGLRLGTVPNRSADIRPVCTRCRTPWERTATGAQWVAENPSGPRRGYHVTRMDHLGQTLWELFGEFVAAQNDLNALAAFHTGALGMLYQGGTNAITDLDIERCKGSIPLDYGGGAEYRSAQVVAGVDVGAVFNVDVCVIERGAVDPADPGAGRRRIRRSAWVGAVRNWSEVLEVFKRYHVDLAVVDAEPEHTSAMEFRDHCNRNTSHLVFLARYTEVPRIDRMQYGLRYDLRDGMCEVQAQKHQLTDSTVAEIRNGLRVLPSDIDLVMHFREHWKNPVRKLVTSKSGERYEWDRGDKRDDYRQADNYARIAADLLDLGSGGAGAFR